MADYYLFYLKKPYNKHKLQELINSLDRSLDKKLCFARNQMIILGNIISFKSLRD